MCVFSEPRRIQIPEAEGDAAQAHRRDMASPDPTVERSEAAQFLSMTLGTLVAQNNHHRPDHQRLAAVMPDARGG